MSQTEIVPEEPDLKKTNSDLPPLIKKKSSNPPLSKKNSTQPPNLKKNTSKVSKSGSGPDSEPYEYPDDDYEDGSYGDYYDDEDDYSYEDAADRADNLLAETYGGELKKDRIEEQKVNIDWDNIPKDDQRFEQIERKVFISFSQKFRKDEIVKRANEINLTVSVKGDTISIKGPKITVDSFLSAMYDIEAEAKKKMYPKYWDLKFQSHMGLLPVNRNDMEWMEITALFTMSMPTCPVISLSRIQNRYLMEHYLNMIQNIQSMRPGERLTRMLLFYGTGNTDPKEIYDNFDMGFDLQFVNADEYGRGFSFAIDAKDTHKYAHKTSKGTYKMLIIDCLVGKIYSSGPAPKLIKPPKGYDSVKVLNDNLFIIYSNFRNYPLYVIEYEFEEEKGFFKKIMGSGK